MKNLIKILVQAFKTMALLYTLSLFTKSYHGGQYNKATIEFLMFAWIFKENYRR